MVPTVLECLEIESPTVIKGVTQSPIEGVSLARTFNDSNAPTKHQTQYFEMIGHRSLYHDGWHAICPWPGPSFTEAGKPFGEPISADTLTELDAKGWELYHVEKDWAENHNVAAENRPKLIEMISIWYAEAGKYNVLSIDGRGVLRGVDERPSITINRTRYIYYPGTQEIPTTVAVKVLNRPYSIIADVEIHSGSVEGILLSHGGI
jgi:arylsulfatase A-like enzyme